MCIDALEKVTFGCLPRTLTRLAYNKPKPSRAWFVPLLTNARSGLTCVAFRSLSLCRAICPSVKLEHIEHACRDLSTISTPLNRLLRRQNTCDMYHDAETTTVTIDEETLNLECQRSSMTAADQMQLDVYDTDMYLDPACVSDNIPNGCNYFGLGQECRGCFMTCDGASTYLEDKAQEIAEKVRA